METSLIKFNSAIASSNPVSKQPETTMPKASNPIANNIFNYQIPYYKAIMPTNNLSGQDREKYIYLLNLMKDYPKSENSEGLGVNQQLDRLLKEGKLLSKAKDKTTTLDNLYEMATTKRAEGLDSRVLISNTLDILLNPRLVTQNFGDIPENVQQQIVEGLDSSDEIKKAPELMNVEASGTCAAASNEVNLADKYPAEYARWVNGLSSTQKAVYLNIPLSALSKNSLDAAKLLQLLEAKVVKFSFDGAKIKVAPDDNAYIRAQIQTKHWDKGERNVANVLIQSAIMQLGSQNTYNSLSDTRGGEFNTNSQGLIEIEKTFVESLIKGKEITSLVYQKIDDDQNLVGYNCSFEKIESHIKNTLDSGDDVIIGYVLTNETSGRINHDDYNPQTDGKPEKIVNGHEITIVGYSKDKEGKTIFTCIDTDDDNPQYVNYSADWLLPKIHHAGFPAQIVEKDEREIMKNACA